MLPELLILAPSPSAAVNAQLEQQYTCHHAWQVPAHERHAWLAERAPSIRAVVTTGALGLNATDMALLPTLEIVAVNGVGLDGVALDLARERGIAVTTTPNVLTDDVADVALALLLASARHIVALDRFVRDGGWERREAIAPASSLRGKTAGIFGFGQIGQAIALRLAAFGIHVRYFQPRAIAGASVPRAESLLALAQESDYLIVCAPGTPATRQIIDRSVLDALGPQGTLINIARGALIDEEALIAALQDGHLGAAGLDVFADEPRVPAALRALPNVVLTPHVGSLTVETRHAMGQLVVYNLAAHFAGLPLLTPVK
ncbi:2-hydroxyacid dehydrogenase [Janthinobacterium lividum]|uniref:2-hydroxyacid dehydrogenase n=1 Tax=Janthinobacterium lividum TaxID=29581 RepID=UPI0008752BB1|nr:2-hydroxyacid dehydrogenase [Janthinobacterium lividum]MCC7713340.1 2-hydroxyacid dehydrogenase [Janthinobacterium lividum]OEZ61161.1 hydroxypyruvate reductase [Janthinobacterium lividum]WQE26408.1 2-hydroxyacid dehydrogenase [Janthinobacterium lividum]STQ97303.1 Glyoxylate/hydroxypyruvate reductase B [Janthinobacterium lividum]